MPLITSVSAILLHALPRTVRDLSVVVMGVGRPLSFGGAPPKKASRESHDRHKGCDAFEVPFPKHTESWVGLG